MQASTTLLVLCLVAAASPAARSEEPYKLGETGISTRVGRGITFERAGFGVALSGRFQPRLDIETAPFAEPAPHVESDAYMRRTRLKLNAWGFGKRISSTLHIELSEHFPSIRDLYLDIQPFDTKWLRLRAGQLKKPFTWQQILSTTRLVLVDRDETDSFFAAGREIGAEIYGGGKELPVFWAVGAFAGTEIDDVVSAARSLPGGRTDPGDLVGLLAPTGVGRLELRFGDVGESEGDAEKGPIRAMVGTSGQARSDLTGQARAVVNVDGAIKWQGVAASGALFVSAARDAGGLPFAEALGGQARLSYTFLRLVEGAVGVSSVVPLLEPAEALHDLKVGGTVLVLRGGALKLGADVGPRLEGFSLDGLSLVGRAHLLLLF